MSFDKENFLRTKLVKYLQTLHPATAPQWGKMNVQQMIEHLSGDALRIANGAIKMDTILTPPEHLQRMREFIMTDKPFKENIKNPLLPAEPKPFMNATVQAAIGELQIELIRFFEVFEQRPGLVTRNPFYGDLNFDQNVQLLYKHTLHHLRQFGVVPLGI